MGIGFGVCAVMTGLVGRIGFGTAVLWWSLILIRGLAGATSAPLHPGAARGVALWATPDTRATANGLVTAGALCGIAVAPRCLGMLIDLFGWPAACVIGGALLIVFALIWQRVAPSHELPSQRHASQNRVPADVSTYRLPYAQDTGVWRLFRNRSLLLLTLSYTALGYQQYVFF